MRVLAIDTALESCSVCVAETGPPQEPIQILAHAAQGMAKGHAEALVPMIDKVVSETEQGFAGLDRIAVTVGPGSFTGLRVGISAARAIALAQGIPAVGVTTLAAYAAPQISAGGTTIVAVAIDARHGAIYFQAFAAGGRTLVSPRIAPLREAVRQLGSGLVRIIGSGAELLAEEARQAGLTIQMADTSPAPDIAWVARLGMAAVPDQALPKPFYLRAPDAKPQAHFHIPRRQGA